MARSANTPISFVLRDPKGRTATPIIGLIRFNNDRLKVATGFKVKPAHWLDATGRVKNVVDATDKDQINYYLQDLEKQVGIIIADLKSKRVEITRDVLRQRINEYLNPVAEQEPTQDTLFTFIDHFIDEAPTRINAGTNKLVGYRTIQKYRTVVKMLHEFAQVYDRPIDFDTIDLEFYEAFKTYLTIKKGFTMNNVGKYIATLKVFLNEASLQETRLGITINPDYRHKRFKVVKEDADNIYLSEAELGQLYNLDLTKFTRLERVRDLFLVGCYTGLRFSDFTAIRPEYIKDGLIRMEQFKTSGKVVIPCHPIVTTLLSKYKGQLPTAISNQKMNDYLKELCQLAGLTTKESKGQTKAGKRVTTIVEKWQLVSTHTARRSFATNMYLLGIPSITIMRITGHKTEKAFMQYIKLDEEQHAKIIALHWQKQLQGTPFTIAS